MKKYVILSMILPVCFVLFSNAAFRHYHILPDGQRIEHAHPFIPCSENQGTNHQHTDRELLLFSVIGDSPVFVSMLPVFIEVYRVHESDLFVPRTRRECFNTPVLYKLLRAPPFMS